MRAKHCLILGLLVSSHATAMDKESPEMDFLEYLGGLETEVDGEIVTPIELELIADNTTGEETDHE